MGRSLTLASNTALISFCLLLSCVPCAQAQVKSPLDQTGCKAYFLLFWSDSHIPGGIAPHWTKGQQDWYLHKGAKKYPNVCVDEKKAAYLFVYTTEAKMVQITQYEVSGGVATATDNNGNTATINLPVEQVPVQKSVERTTVYLSVFSVSGGKVGQIPLQVFVRGQHARAGALSGNPVIYGLAGQNDSSREALEDAIRFVSKTTGK